MTTQENIAQHQEQRALTKYNSRFVPDVYRRATHNRSSAYANALINEALAICGSPYYKLTHRRWHGPARTFLQLFSD